MAEVRDAAGHTSAAVTSVYLHIAVDDELSDTVTGTVEASPSVAATVVPIVVDDSPVSVSVSGLDPGSLPQLQPEDAHRHAPRLTPPATTRAVR